jgi:hypothetical protein
MCERQRLQDHRVNKSERFAIRTDADRQSQSRREGKSGSVPEQTRG